MLTRIITSQSVSEACGTRIVKIRHRRESKVRRRWNASGPNTSSSSAVATDLPIEKYIKRSPRPFMPSRRMGAGCSLSCPSIPHASFHPRGKRERLAVKMKMMMVIILLLLNDVLLPMLACLSQSSLIMMLCCSAWRGTKSGHTRSSSRGRIGPGQFSQKCNSVFCMCRLLLCPPIPTYLPSVPIDSSRSLLLLIPGLQIPFHFIPISHTDSDEYALFGPRCCTFSVC